MPGPAHQSEKAAQALRYSLSCWIPRATSTLIEITQIGQNSSSGERVGCSPQRAHMTPRQRARGEFGYGSFSSQPVDSRRPAARQGLSYSGGLGDTGTATSSASTITLRSSSLGSGLISTSTPFEPNHYGFAP